MTGSPLTFINSKIRSRSWNVNISISSLRRSCKGVVTPREETPTLNSSSQSCSNTSSPTRSSFSKKGSRIFSKRSTLWKGRRESRDDFGNRWSKIYIPGHSRSATPLPDVTTPEYAQHSYPHHQIYHHQCINTTPNMSRGDFFSEDIEIATRRFDGNLFDEKWNYDPYANANEFGFMAGLACFHLNMSMYDVEHDEVFGHTFSLRHVENDPYMMNTAKERESRTGSRLSMRRTLSWLPQSWGSSLNLPLARSSTPVLRTPRARSLNIKL